MTFIAFESFAVTTILPVAVADLADTGWYSFAYAATMTTTLFGMVIGGNWADRSGPRRPLVVGGTLFLLGLLLNVVPVDITVFVCGRLLQGAGGGIDSVILYVLIARHIPDASRPRMFGLLTTAWLVPSLAGPVVAGLLTELTNWRVIFGIVLVGSAASLLSLLRATRGARDASTVASRTSGRRAWTHIVGRNGALAVLASGLLIVLHLSAQVNAPSSAAVVVCASFALVVTARHILPAGTLLLRGAPQQLIVLRASLGAGVTTANLYLTLYLQSERGFPPASAGLVIAVAAGGWALGAWCQGRFPSTHVSHRRLIVCATFLVAVGPAGVLTYTATALPLWIVVVACVVMGTGMGIAYPRVSSATLALASPDERGAYSSALQTGESMGIGVVTALAAAVLVGGGTFTTIFAILTGLACATILVACVSGDADERP
ncbi:MFS transporter [Microbacterium faecale]|nr:MFS transporter [Microbacterium faecale]